MEESFEKRIEKLKSVSQNISLRKEEKLLMRENINKYMESFPLIAKLGVIESLMARLNSWKQAILSFRLLALKKTKIMITAIISLVLALSGGVSFAAQGSVPGDALYPIKVNVNEKAQVLLAVSPEAKLALQGKLAEYRLEEASKLAAEGKLNAENKKELEARFKANVKVFTENSKKLSDNDKNFNPTDLNIRFESQIKAYEAVLQNILNQSASTTATSTTNGANQFLFTINDAKMKIQENRGQFELKLGGTLSVLNGSTTATTTVKVHATSTKEMAEGKQRAAENVLASAKSMFERAEDKLATTTEVQVQAKLDESNRNIVEGKTKVTAGNYAGAIINFQTAIRLANDAKVLTMTSLVKTHIKIDIRDDHKDKKDKDDDKDDKHRDNDDKYKTSTTTYNKDGKIYYRPSIDIKNIIDVKKVENNNNNNDNDDDDNKDEKKHVETNVKINGNSNNGEVNIDVRGKIGL